VAVRFSVTFTKELTCDIEAESYEELEAACRLHCTRNDPDDWNPEGWNFDAQEVRTIWGGQRVAQPMSEPDMGVANGECWAMCDYREYKAKADAARAEDPNYVDPRQGKLPFKTLEVKE
jgi:hypothetical protein